MFLFEKYKPKSINDFMFNHKILYELMYMATHEDIPHIIISGPSGGGKKTLVKFFLEALYDSDVNKLTKVKYNVNGSSTKKDIEIMQSNYHIVIEPTNTNHDKYILQEIIKQYARHGTFNIFRTNRKFKTIVIYNIENLASNSQAALRRTMELYAKTCRFVMICNNLSKIFDPLRSRCSIFCIPKPSINDITSIIDKISTFENIILTNKDMKNIIDRSCGDLKHAIWILDTIRLNINSEIALNKILDDDIRSNIYNILITNIKGTDIIINLLDRLILKINDDIMNIKIIQIASEAECNMTYGRRDIIHIDYFIAGVMKILLESN